MSFHPQAFVRGKRLIKDCPICGGDMERKEIAGSNEKLWQCTNDNCGHREVA